MRRLLCVVFLLGIAACLPGREGWECEMRGSTVQAFKSPSTGGGDDCNDGLVCRSASGYSRSGHTTKHVCMAVKATDVGTTYNWMHVILSWLMVAIFAIATVVVTVKKLRKR